MQLRQLVCTSTNDFWEKQANKALSHFSFRYPDEIDMYELCRRYGMKIKPLDPKYFDEDELEMINIDADSFSVPKSKGRRGVIYLKPDLDSLTKKLLLAEEFCHLYTHYENQLWKNQYFVNKTENQALRMSAYLLMPARFMDDVYVAALDDRVLVSDIADYFVVPEEFAHYRLQLIFNQHVDMFASVSGQVGRVKWLV